MSLDIDGLGQIKLPDVSPRTTATSGSADFTSVYAAAQGAAVSVDIDSSFPSTPPAEVKRAMAVASDAYEHLNATGQQIHFALTRPTGGLSAQLQDLDGNPLTNISASEALRIAGGERLN